jgi:hypothetical protein
MHLNELFEWSVFFEMYIDDLYPPNNDDAVLDGRPAVARIQRGSSRSHFHDTIKWLKAFLDAERRMMEEMRAERVDWVRNHLALFAGGTATEMLIGAVEKSWSGY